MVPDVKPEAKSKLHIMESSSDIFNERAAEAFLKSWG